MKSIVKILVLQFLFSASIFSQTEEFGIASYYSDLFHGKPTASGEMYDMNKLTAAHKTYPFGSVVRITRLDNKKSVDVTINDRGPFISGRVIEVSKAAAIALDLLKDGSARVRVELVKQKTGDATAAKPSDQPKSYEETTPAIKTGDNKVTASKGGDTAKPEPPKTTSKDKNVPTEANKETAAKGETGKDKDTAKGGVTKDKGGEVKSKQAADAPKAVLVKAADYQTFDLYQIELKRPEKKGFGVQIAALSSQDALFRKLAELQGDWFSGILVSIEQGAKSEMQYKIILGTFPDEKSAQVYKDNLKKNKKIDGFVVNLESMAQKK